MTPTEREEGEITRCSCPVRAGLRITHLPDCPERPVSPAERLVYQDMLAAAEARVRMLEEAVRDLSVASHAALDLLLDEGYSWPLVTTLAGVLARPDIARWLPPGGGVR